MHRSPSKILIALPGATLFAALLGVVATTAPVSAQAPASTQPPVSIQTGPRIFIASDSTAQDYKAERYPQSGWGTMLRCAVDPSIVVENRAIGGRSTKSFIAEGRLDAIARDLRAGDTLLVQFGHNDANSAKPERYASIPDYAANLKRFIAVAVAAKARVVLITPVTRRAFVNGHVTSSFPTYAAAARRVAAETHTPIIDLASLSERWIDAIGADASARYYLHYTGAAGAPGYPNGVDDDTHFSELGARQIANLVATALARLGLPISAHVHGGSPALTRTTPAGGPSCAR